MRIGIALLIVCAGSSSPLAAQERPLGAAAAGATAQERLLMEQIDQLAAAGQTSEAIGNLERLVDNAEGRLIELGPVQRAATLTHQLHAPIAHWAQRRLVAWSDQAPEKLLNLKRAQQELVLESSRRAKASLDWREMQKMVDRYALAPESISARLVLCDLYLDRGWTVAARQALTAPGLSLRVPAQLGEVSDVETVGALPWPTAWPHMRKLAQRAQWLDQSKAALQTTPTQSRDQLAAEVTSRLVSIAAFDCPESEFADTCDWALAMAERLPADESGRVAAKVAEARTWFNERQSQHVQQWNGNWLTFAGDASRSGVAGGNLAAISWPAWTNQVERLTSGTDRNPVSKPPVAEKPLGLVSYHPVVHRGQVFVNELTSIAAFDLNDGRSWPPMDPALPVFDSGMTAANYIPFGYALMGSPRGTLTIDRDTLYARMGPPVTGWYGRAPAGSDSSLSYLIALDLNRQGSMRLGFPVRLSSAQFPGTEFEGSPLVVEEQLITAIGTRDNVNLRRSVVSLDKKTGAMRWRSPTLASGTVSGSEQASLIAHQLVSASGGRVYVNTNLGAIACLDQSTGQIVWLARYRRSPPSVDQPYPHQDRFRYRDLSPCMVTGTQVICAPQDCPEIFSLDGTTGDLLWSTDAERVDEATQILGASGESIIVAGDRIFWLERSSGRVLAAFPAGSTSDANGSLPAPRGYGRGIVGADQVYWPTQNEIFVFDADQAESAVGATPAIRQRMRLDVHGAEGGNLVLFKDGLVIAGASRLFVFRHAAPR